MLITYKKQTKVNKIDALNVLLFANLSADQAGAPRK